MSDLEITPQPLVYRLDSRAGTMAMIPAILLFSSAIPVGVLMIRESLQSGQELFKGIFVVLFSPFLLCVFAYIWWMKRGATLVIDGDEFRHVNGKGQTVVRGKASDVIGLYTFKGFLQRKVNCYFIDFPNNRRMIFDRHTVGLETLIYAIEQRTGKRFGPRSSP